MSARSRTDRVQLIGFAIVLCAFALANTLINVASGAHGPWRMVALSGILAVGLLGLWTLRTPVAALGVLAAALVVGVVLTALRLDPLPFRAMAPSLGIALALWVMSWVVVRYALPRLEPERRMLALVLGIGLFVGHLAGFVGMFGVANPWFQLHRTEPLTTLAAIDTAARSDLFARQTGVLVTGSMPENAGGASILSRGCPREASVTRTLNLTAQAVSGPPRFELILDDGARVETMRIARAREGIDWPALDTEAGCGLRPGDPVVVWATPHTNGATLPPSLEPVRMIAYGSLDAFREGPAARAEFAARMFGGVAFMLILTGLIPLIAGIRRWLALRG